MLPHSRSDPPRLTELGCAGAATSIGLAYLHFGAAPPRYMAVNLGALLLGSLCLLVYPSRWKTRTTGYLIVAVGVVLCAVGIWGESSHGVSRWLMLGELAVQPSMILLPFAAVMFARKQNGLAAAGMALVAIGTAMQPDRSMAGALSFGLLFLWLVEPNRWTVAACIVAIGAFAVTLFRPDTVPLVSFVEKVFISAFVSSRVMGFAVIAGAIILLLPAVVTSVRWSYRKSVHGVFAAIWTGLFLSTLLGNYPTPVLGSGSSGILGYLLSVACLNSGDERDSTNDQEREVGFAKASSRSLSTDDDRVSRY